jgi:L-lactate dehydrogenase complex protein LldG
MKSAREEILNNLRKQIPMETPALPEVIQGEWIRYVNPVEQFANLIAGVGGSCQTVANRAEIQARLESFPEYRDAKRIYSQVAGIPSHFDLDAVEQPQDLEDLDFVIYPGQFAIAENGAVWVTDQGLKHRVIFFITQHLVLVVEKKDLLHTMHEAYARIEFQKPGFGLFISGPSKTADIEQSLVIGAHGCRSMQVYLVEG